jgi:hypothetical protein
LEERIRREEAGETDRDANHQMYLMPDIDEKLVRFKIEIMMVLLMMHGVMV